MGKAYWETPIGTIRENDFQVLKNIQASGKPYPRLEMAGQHPKAAGPDEGRVMSDKGYLKKEYPFMEYWKKCTVVNRDIRQIIPIAIKTRIDKVDDNKVAVAEVRGSSIISDKKFSSTDQYRVRMRVEVSNNPNGPLGIREGEIVIEVNPAWSPLGARRFFNMVQSGFFSDCKFFRVSVL